MTTPDQRSLDTAAKQAAADVAQAEVNASKPDSTATNLTFLSTYNGSTLTISGKSQFESASVTFDVNQTGRQELASLHLGTLTTADYQDAAAILADNTKSEGITVASASMDVDGSKDSWAAVSPSRIHPDGVNNGNENLQWLTDEGTTLLDRSEPN